MRILFFTGLVCCLLLSCGSAPEAAPRPVHPADASFSAEPETAALPRAAGEPLPVSSFNEIWGYVIAGRETALKADFPLSDAGYFGAELDSYGRLTGVPARRRLSFFSGRVHLVVASSSRSLTHFALEEGSRTRRQLIIDLLEASRPYDGLQIDFENVPARDGDSFTSFLEELKKGLGRKLLTVALPARTRAIQNDVYDYRKILPLVDRILIMAYDEHWSGSSPGPIASLDWCKNVARYGLETIGAEKLIMGLPFYGRTWGENPNRAFFYSGIERIKKENEITEIRRIDGVPSFTYETRVTVTAYYEDAFSLSGKLETYRTMGIKSVGFWSVGQETSEAWSILSLE
jgi:spore germination protein YaaH